MKPTELRIGNLVEYNGMYLPISSIKSPKPLKDKRFADKWLIELFDGASWIDCIIDDIKPIPLTEEWLLKFGFENSKNLFGKKDFRFTISKPSNYDGFVLCDGYLAITANLLFVHQLQNLYFALTGEELTIK